MIQMDSSFFNVESICGFISTFVAVCSDTSHPFGFTPRSKISPLDTLKFIVTKLRNHDNKVALIIVDEYGALEIYYEFMNTCHNMNIIFKLQVGIHLISMVKSKFPLRQFII